MNTVRQRRLMFVMVLMIVSLLIGYLIILALRQNVNFFFTPSQVVAGEAKNRLRLRIGGMVEKGSLIRKEGLNIQFRVTDFAHHLTVYYSGILPDLFKEGQGVVAIGRLSSNNIFLADEILAKHDENYMPPELNQVIKK